MIDKNDPRLTAFLVGELDQDDLAAVETALDESPELRQHVEGLKATIGSLSTGLSASDDGDLTMTEDQLQQIDAEIAKGQLTKESATSDLGRIRWRHFAIAALVLYAVGISVFALRKPTMLTGKVPIDPPAIVHPMSEATADDSLLDNTSVTESWAMNPQRIDDVGITTANETEAAGDLMRSVEDPFGAASVDDEKGSSRGRAVGGGGFADAGGDDAFGEVEEVVEEMLETLDVTGDGQPQPGQIVIRGNPDDLDLISGLIGDGEPAGGESRASETIGFDGIAGLPDTKLDLALGAEFESPARIVFDDGEAGEPAAADTENEELRKTIETQQAQRDKLRQARKAAAKTWKPASAATNRARLSVGHHDDLALTARDTYVRIDGFRARVFFDCYYYNDRPQQLEGQFMLRLPSDASLHYFAFGPTSLPTPDAPPATGKPGEAAGKQLTAAGTAVSALREHTGRAGSDLARRAGDSSYAAEPNTVFGLVKAAHVAPRQQAALAYEETVRRRVDPALVEWAGPGIFQTRVFPLVPNQLHRIVIGYDVTLLDDGLDRVFSLDLPEGEAGGRVEFDIAAAAGTQATITPDTEAFVSGGRACYRFENAEPRDYTVRMSGTESVVLTSGNVGNDGLRDSYFATRLIAQLPDAEAKTTSRRAIFLLDTSWSDRPAAFSRRLNLLQQILEQNQDTIEEFAVLLFNVEQRWWRSKFSANDDTNLAALLRDADQLALEGATDLYGALNEATSPFWIPQRDRATPQANYFLLSDGSATWGRTDLASLADPLSQLDRAAGSGALFAYHLAGHSSDKATLSWLAEASGGAVFDVAEEPDLASVALAHRSRPWQIVSAKARGADQILMQGSAQTVYPNQPLMIAGRGRIEGPLRIEFQRGAEKKTLKIEPKLSIASPAAARLFGQLAVEQLEPYTAELAEVTVAFARYFRVPGRTCSMVMLDGPADYERFGVNVSPQDDQLVIASTSVGSAIESVEAKLSEQRAQPRKRFIAWVDSLESASLLNVPTALRLAMQRLPDTAFRFDADRLECQSWKVDQLGSEFGEQLKLDAPEFAAVMVEAQRKLNTFGADDALKTVSTLVEAKPSDADTLRSVAFRAIEWQRSDQAGPLLWRLAQARPYQPQCLLLLARAMSESGETDSAIVCYDLVSSGNWHERWAGAKDIAEIELLHVLEQVNSGNATSQIPQYARARLQQLRDRWYDEGLDVAVIMHWNTDRTDVDLHVTEPSGEECFYSHNRTKAGGQLTQDITEGLGPEMYSLETAPQGQYKVAAKYYRSDNNRTKAPTEAMLTVLRNLGRRNMQTQTESIQLNGTGEKQVVLKINMKP